MSFCARGSPLCAACVHELPVEVLEQVGVLSSQLRPDLLQDLGYGRVWPCTEPGTLRGEIVPAGREGGGGGGGRTRRSEVVGARTRR